MPVTAARSRVPSLVVLCVILSATFGAQVQPNNLELTPELTAHEWGTFTSIAGRDGQAVKWSTLNGSVELPRFVEHFAGPHGKDELLGTIRMETPVLYFYSPHETSVTVKVAFSKGVITEWYPHASRVEPDPKRFLDREALYYGQGSGRIAWNSVTVSPNMAGNMAASFPQDAGSPDDRENQYYAARETSAAPLVVHTSAGDQHEKFLFYRGVSAASVPITATVTSAGQVHVANPGAEEIPSVILFERRGDKMGYRLGGSVPGEVSLDPPELTATVDSMSRDIEDILTGQGLYPEEAHAMIETWRQSWFEEGSRLFYIVPGSFLNKNLRLTVNPTPAKTVRVFVGRLELITPATEQAVQKVLSTHDHAGLLEYRRFLEPILDEMKAANPAQAAQIDTDLDLTYQRPIHPPSDK
jgi:hypothetical protein